jgi:hypothetical protein
MVEEIRRPLLEEQLSESTQLGSTKEDTERQQGQMMRWESGIVPVENLRNNSGNKDPPVKHRVSQSGGNCSKGQEKSCHMMHRFTSQHLVQDIPRINLF